MFRNFLYATFILTLVSCEQKSQPERQESLIRINESIANNNIRELKELKAAIEAAGNRTADDQMLKELESIIPYFQHHTEADLFNNIEALDSISRLDMWYISEELLGQMAVINEMAEVYRESQDSVDLELTKGGLNLLQASFIRDRQMKITYDTFDPLPVHFFINDESLDIGDPLQIILTLGKPLDENLFELGQEEVGILYEDHTIEDFEFTEIGRGSWILGFTPQQNGKYIIRLSGHVRATIDKVAISYPFNGRHELHIK